MPMKKTRTLPLVLACLVSLGGGFPSVALAQSQEDRVRQLENQVQTLSRAVFRGEAAPVSSESFSGGGTGVQAANLEVRLTQIEQELRALTGKVETQAFELQRLKERLDAGDMFRSSGSQAPSYQQQQPLVSGGLSADEFRDNPVSAQTSGGFSSSGSVQSAPLGNLSSPSSGSSSQGATGDYEQAFAILRRGDYAQAEQAFRSFIDRYPSDELIPNAQYWLAETYYVRGEYETSARSFAEAYQKHPTGPKAADNLLKLGLSLTALGKTQDACLSYGQLRREFSAGAAPVLRRAEQEMDRLHCAN